jgi:type VI secretion system Hcp family effector
MGTRRAKRAGFALCLCLVAMGLAAQPSWADDAFAKITGSIQGVILGDQPDVKGIAGSKDAVQVFSTAFGLAVPVSTSTSGGGATLGKPQAGPLAVVKRFDRASPKLLRAAFTGESLTVEITWFMFFQTAPRKTVTIKLEGAFVTNMEAAAELQGSSASGFETVSFTYSKITFSTPIIDPVTGQITGTSSVCLDVALNRAC